MNCEKLFKSLFIFKPDPSYTIGNDIKTISTTVSTASKREILCIPSQIAGSWGPSLVILKQIHLKWFIWGTFWTIVLTVGNRKLNYFNSLFSTFVQLPKWEDKTGPTFTLKLVPLELCSRTIISPATSYVLEMLACGQAVNTEWIEAVQRILS